MITTRTVLLVSIEMLLVKVQQERADSVLPLQAHTRTPRWLHFTILRHRGDGDDDEDSVEEDDDDDVERT